MNIHKIELFLCENKGIDSMSFLIAVSWGYFMMLDI